MTAFPDHYATLGIDPTADQEVITAAYRALAKKYHPDTGAPRGTASAERFAEIQQAYEVLGSAESRRQYDLELLEATRRELDEHLAAKQRKLEGATGTAAACVRGACHNAATPSASTTTAITRPASRSCAWGRRASPCRRAPSCKQPPKAKAPCCRRWRWPLALPARWRIFLPALAPSACPWPNGPRCMRWKAMPR